MSKHIPAAIQREVRERAGERCEYCRLAQAGQEATFHVDHIHPRRLGGETVLDNLALSCVSCSLRKGGRADAKDPERGETVHLFHPRRDRWEVHFRVTVSYEIVGLTGIGRATVALLRMNRPLVVFIRQEESARGRFP